MSELTRRIVIAFGLVAAVFAVYAETLDHEFVLFDDDQYVYENVHVTNGLTVEGLRYFATNPHSINWHPLTSVSHMLDAEWFGLDAGKHHGTSVVLHALAALLLFAALRALTQATWTSAFVALFFAVHPLRVESVAWVSERKDVLSGVFFAATLWAYARYARSPTKGTYLIVTACLVAGLLSKPMLVTLPALLLVLDGWPLGRFRETSFRRLVVEKLPWFAAAALCGVVTLLIQSGSGTVRPFEALDLPTRIATALAGTMQYLRATFLPTDLAFFYPHPALTHPESYSPFSLATWVAVLALVLITGLCLRTRRTQPWLLVGWLWFLGMLAPVSGLLQAGEQAWADRYAYLPTLGLYVGLAFAARAWIAKSQAAPWVAMGACLAAIPLGILAHEQTRTWSTSAALFEHAVEVTDDNYMALNNLGLVRLNQGRATEARDCFVAATQTRPQDKKAQINLGIALASTGDLEAAEAHLRKLTERYPEEARLHANLGSVLARAGRLKEARERLERALLAAPDLVDANCNLGLVLLQTGDPLGAAKQLDRTLGLAPWHAIALYNRGLLHAAGGEHRQAEERWSTLLEVAPEHNEGRLQLAWLLATSDVEAVRDGARARALLRPLVAEPSSRSGAPRWHLLSVLAATAAATGDFRAAIAAQEEALGLAPPARKNEHREWLELYRSKTPLRLEGR